MRIEILAHRVLWSLVTVVLVMVALRRTRIVLAAFADPRTRWLLLLAAAVISVNWGGYIWGVNNGRVVETSLGYFINPLVTVLMGVAGPRRAAAPAAVVRRRAGQPWRS